VSDDISERDAHKAKPKELCDSKDHWDQIQKECPGITREEYMAELEADIQLIKETFYSKNGFLKPRLVRGVK
jgi:hypothetical protein